MVGAQTLGHALGIGFGTQQRCMGVVVIVVLRSLVLAATFLIQVVSSQIVQIYKLHACFLHHLTIPQPIRVIATLNLAVLPFVARCKRYQNRCSPLLGTS